MKECPHNDFKKNYIQEYGEEKWVQLEVGQNRRQVKRKVKLGCGKWDDNGYITYTHGMLLNLFLWNVRHVKNVGRLTLGEEKHDVSHYRDRLSWFMKKMKITR